MRPSSLSVLTLLLLGALACKKEEDGEEEVNPVVNVRMATVSQGAFTETIGAIGTVAPRPGHVASLGAPAPTRVASVSVSVGQHVTRGQTLVELEQQTFQAAAQGADAALAAAERAHERAQRLAAEGIAPRKDVEQAAAEVARARADAVAAKRAEQLSILRSPINGVVTRLDATLGASVDVSQPLVEVADPSALDIVLNVTPSEAGRVKIGARVSLSAGQSADGEPLGIGGVEDVAGTVDSTTRSVAVRIRAPTRRPLRIGETVFGQITVGTRARALTVPLEALVPEGEGFKVFVVDSASVAHAREVHVGARSDSTAEITAGLEAGERIVTYGAYGVADGAKVAPLKSDQPAKDTVPTKSAEKQ
jgi:RND family efflux transporter MFP subunit